MERKILIVEDWILFEWNEDNLKDEKWTYKVRDQEWKFLLVDKDKSKAQPMVKTILNEIDLFPELKMLKIIQWMLLLLIVIGTIWVLYEFARLPTVKDFERLETKINSLSWSTNKKIIPEEEIKRIISNFPQKWMNENE